LKKSRKYGIAANVKKTAAVSIMKVRPQNTYIGVDHNKIKNTQGVSSGSASRLFRLKAGHAQAIKNKKLTKRPTGSNGKFPPCAIIVTIN
jgi:hypothetical protein